METPRYFYHPDLSIWRSVDPLSDKYPNLTPYAYCANNPVILGYPDGREIETNLNDIYVNTKTKQVSEIKTNDDFDRIIVDGEFMKTKEKGVF